MNNVTHVSHDPIRKFLRRAIVSPSTILAVDNGVFYSVDGLNWTKGNAQVMGF
jgi:hypothetical protein